MNPVNLMPAKTYRNYCFTVWDDIFAPVFWQPGHPVRSKFKHLCFSLETSEEGKLHLQGYGSVWHPCTAKAAKDALQAQWSTAHCDAMKGSYVTSEAYCSKESYYHEYGIRPNESGVKHSLLGYKRRVDDGESVMDIAEDDKMFGTFCQYRGGLKEYEEYVRGKRIKMDRSVPEVYIRWGPPATGKTRWLDEQYGVGNWARMPNPTSSWFITRTVANSDVILIDDVGPTKIPKIEELLEWTDRYPIEFNSKGSYFWFKPKVIVITSNIHPRGWWPNVDETQYTAFLRRVTSVVEVGADI